MTDGPPHTTLLLCTLREACNEAMWWTDGCTQARWDVGRDPPHWVEPMPTDPRGGPSRGYCSLAGHHIKGSVG